MNIDKMDYLNSTECVNEKSSVLYMHRKESKKKSDTVFKHTNQIYLEISKTLRGRKDCKSNKNILN